MDLKWQVEDDEIGRMSGDRSLRVKRHRRAAVALAAVVLAVLTAGLLRFAQGQSDVRTLEAEIRRLVEREEAAYAAGDMAVASLMLSNPESVERVAAERLRGESHLSARGEVGGVQIEVPSDGSVVSRVVVTVTYPLSDSLSAGRASERREYVRSDGGRWTRESAPATHAERELRDWTGRHFSAEVPSGLLPSLVPRLEYVDEVLAHLCEHRGSCGGLRLRFTGPPGTIRRVEHGWLGVGPLEPRYGLDPEARAVVDRTVATAAVLEEAGGFGQQYGIWPYSEFRRPAPWWDGDLQGDGRSNSVSIALRVALIGGWLSSVGVRATPERDQQASRGITLWALDDLDETTVGPALSDLTAELLARHEPADLLRLADAVPFKVSDAPLAWLDSVMEPEDSLEFAMRWPTDMRTAYSGEDRLALCENRPFLWRTGDTRPMDIVATVCGARIEGEDRLWGPSTLVLGQNDLLIECRASRDLMRFRREGHDWTTSVLGEGVSTRCCPWRDFGVEISVDPTGQHVAWVSESEGGAVLQAVDLGASRPAVRTLWSGSPQEPAGIEVAWSPDGRSVAIGWYAHLVTGTVAATEVVNVGDGQVLWSDEHAWMEQGFLWSPSGRWIAYLANWAGADGRSALTQDAEIVADDATVVRVVDSTSGRAVDVLPEDTNIIPRVAAGVHGRAVWIDADRLAIGLERLFNVSTGSFETVPVDMAAEIAARFEAQIWRSRPAYPGPRWSLGGGGEGEAGEFPIPSCVELKADA